MKKQKVPEMFADSKTLKKLKELKKLKNWFRLELVKTEKDEDEDF